jgi:hypothetical protein
VLRSPALLVGLAATALYCATAERGLTGGDAGELILSARLLAVAHPPGYPLYTLLGHVFTALPFDSLALRLNLLSAVCGGAAMGALCAALLSLGVRLRVALATCACAATSSLVWQWATRAEVFSLNQALCLAALALAASTNHAPRAVLLCGLTTGLALSNHHTALFFAGPVFAAAWLSAPTHLKRPALLLLLTGLLPYALLPLFQSHAPRASWGETHTLDGLLNHLLRRDYGTWSLAPQSGATAFSLAPMWVCLGALGRSLAWVGVPLAILGAATVVRARRQLGLAMVVAAVLLVPVFHLLSRFPLDTPLLESVLLRFSVLPLLLLFVWLGAGLEALAGRHASAGTLGVFAALCLTVFQVGAVVARPPEVDLFEPWAAEALRPLPANAVLLSRGDVFTNTLRYAQHTGQRPDVVVLDQEMLTFPWYVARESEVVFPGIAWFPRREAHFDLRSLVAANPGRDFFSVGALKTGDDSLVGQGQWVTFGLTQRWQTQQPALDATVARARELAASPFFARARQHGGGDLWAKVLRDEAWESINRAAVSLLTMAPPDSAAAFATTSVELLSLLTSEHPDPAPEHWRNLAIAASRTGNAALLRTAASEYLRLAPDASDRTVFEQALR